MAPKKQSMTMAELGESIGATVIDINNPTPVEELPVAETTPDQAFVPSDDEGNASDGTTSSSEASDASEKSNMTNNPRGDDGGYPDEPSSSAGAMASSSAAQEVPVPVASDPPFTDAEIEELMASLSDMTVDEAKAVKKKFDDRINYLKQNKKAFNEKEPELTKKARAEAKKEKTSGTNDAKKQKDLEDREDFINVNVRPASEGAPFSIRIQKGRTIKTLKVMVMTRIHGDEGEKKLLKRAKQIRMTHTNQNKEIENTDSHHRTTVRSFGIEDGHTISITALGVGGGKRGSSSVGVKTKDEFNAAVMEEIDILAMRLQAVGSGSPHIETAMKKVLDIKNGINTKQNVFPMLLSIIEDASVAQLMTEVMPSSSKPLERSKKIASIVFHQDLKSLEELRTQRAKVVEVMGNAIHMAVIAEYGDKYCNISWEAFSQDLVKRSKETKTETPTEGGKP